MAFLLGALAAGGIAVVWQSASSSASKDAVEKPRPLSLATLLGRRSEELDGIDIALTNLASAEGLPGAEALDVPACLETLERWAQRVASETKRNLHRFREDPQEYNNSEGYFRIMMLITVLQQDFGVRYSPTRIRDIDFRNSQDLFIHGMTGNGSGGTCVSMPVLYVAVARRLHYPVYLVLAKAHVFARWETPDGKERFNIEGTNKGLTSFDDEYYKTWPMKMATADLKTGRYLKSLTAAEEFAVFLAARGNCLQDTGRLADAQLAYAQAHRLDPKSPEYLGFLAEAVHRELGPSRLAEGPFPGKNAPPRDPLEGLRRVEAINAHNRRLVGPNPAGFPPPPLPAPLPSVPGMPAWPVP